MRHLFFLIILVGSHSHAVMEKGCETVFNLPEFLVKPRDQADIGWCYAYSSADLVSAYIGQEISAADIAITYNYSKVNQSFSSGHDKTEPHRTGLQESGREDLAIPLSSREGFCLEKDFPSSVMVQLVDNAKVKMTEIKKVSLSDRIYLALQLGRLNYTPKDCMTSGALSAFPGLDFERLSEILATTSGMEGDKNRSTRAAYLSHANCENKRIAAPFSKDDIKTERLSLEAMDKILAEGKVSTVMVPFIPYIQSPTSEELDAATGDRVKLEKSGGAHSMLLVGRRWNSESKICEYVFKNSWGDLNDKSRKTKDGYTFIGASKLSKVIGGRMTSINKAPNWKPLDAKIFFDH